MAIRSRPSAIAAAVFAIGVLGAAAAGAWSTPGPHGTAAPSHTVVVVLENHEYSDVIGSPEAPYLNALSRRGALATRYHGIAHPSLPNYLAILGGSTFGITDDCTACSVSAASFPEQLSRAGVSWRAYMDGLPHACFGGAEEGPYVKRHNPFMYFKAIAAVPSRCRNVVPRTRLETDLRRRTLPAFAWLSPGLCDDGHSCGIGAADRAMAELVPRLRRQLGRDGLLIVTFDEGTSDAACCGLAAGGRVATILLGPGIPAGTRLTRPSTHYSLLATLEDRFGLPRLRHARRAAPLAAAFGPASVE